MIEVEKILLVASEFNNQSLYIFFSRISKKSEYYLLRIFYHPNFKLSSLVVLAKIFSDYKITKNEIALYNTIQSFARKIKKIIDAKNQNIFISFSEDEEEAQKQLEELVSNNETNYSNKRNRSDSEDSSSEEESLERDPKRSRNFKARMKQVYSAKKHFKKYIQSSSSDDSDD
jgi:hypothetical protein